MKDRLENWII